MKSPCMNCEERTFYCHSVCEEYAKYRAERDRINERRRAENEKYYQYIYSLNKTKKKYKK